MATTIDIPEASTSFRQTLLAAGFDEAAGQWRRGPVAARLEEDWLVFQLPASIAPGHWQPLSLGQPGLWKPSSADEFVFEIPLSLLATVPDDLDDDEYESSANGRVASQLADWAVATLDPAAPIDWHAPEKARVQSWLPSQSLVIQQNSLVRQIVLVCDSWRLALRCVLVPELSASLSPARRAWIEKTLATAQCRWRMTRLGFGGTQQKPTIEAEIDLTACPVVLASQLVLSGREALEAVARRVLPTLSVLCDPAVPCETWESLF